MDGLVILANNTAKSVSKTQEKKNNDRGFEINMIQKVEKKIEKGLLKKKGELVLAESSESSEESD